MDAPEAFRRGVAAFDEGRFFEAHECWEAVWSEAPTEARPYYRGLIQLAAACLKIRQGAYVPARRLLLRALESAAHTPHPGRAALLAHGQALLARLEALGPDRITAFEPGWLPRLGTDRS